MDGPPAEAVPPQAVGYLNSLRALATLISVSHPKDGDLYSYLSGGPFTSYQLARTAAMRTHRT
jgi:hypothetical protein